MATLNGQQIDNTYPGLIKTNDEAAVGATLKGLEDGVGTTLPIQVSTTGVNFTGTVTGDNNTTYDLASAQSGSDVDVTLTGSDATTDTVKLVAGTNVTLTDSGTNQITIDAAGGGGGSAGLESGTGADSMQSAAALTTVGANASGASAIALGDSATAPNTGDVNIGDGNAIASKASLPGDVVIGQGNNSSTVNGGENVLIGKNNSVTQNERNVAIGYNNSISRGAIVALGFNNVGSSAYGQVLIGNSVTGSSSDSIGIGSNVTISGSGSDGRIAIGKNAAATNNKAVAIGVNGTTCSSEGIAFGDNVDVASDRAIGIGNAINIGAGAADAIAIGTGAVASASKAMCIGYISSATAPGAIVIGDSITGAKANTLTTKALELLTNSTPTAGGIVLHDAGGTERRLNIASDGTLQVDSTVVGPATFTTGRVSETQATSSCDTIRTAVLIPANTFKAGDQLEVTSMQKLAGSTGTTYAELWISTTGTIGSAPTGQNVSQIHSSVDGVGIFNKKLYIDVANGTGNGTEFVESVVNNETGFFSTGQTAAVVIQGAIDWTVDQYLVTKVCIDNAGATWTNYGASIRKIN